MTTLVTIYFAVALFVAVLVAVFSFDEEESFIAKCVARPIVLGLLWPLLAFVGVLMTLDNLLRS